MSSVLCHIGKPRSAKPESLQAYGKLREQLITGDWTYLPEHDFIRKVTLEGSPFYSCLFTRDLMELGQEKLCWKKQQFIAMDFDKVDVGVYEMVARYSKLGLTPRFSYHSFSNDPNSGLHNYRLVWRVEDTLNDNYEETFTAIKKMRELSGNLADRNACSVTRLWQGTRSGVTTYDSCALPLNVKNLCCW
jgi:hypothetical protein